MAVVVTFRGSFELWKITFIHSHSQGQDTQAAAAGRVTPDLALIKTG